MKNIFILFLLSVCTGALAQTNGTAPDVIVSNVLSETHLSIKSATKINEKPVIADTIKKMGNLNYNITSKPVATTYDPQHIVAAKMVNEPLSKLYHCLIKVGLGNYTTPYAELFVNNTRSKETAYGFRYKHLSSTATLKSLGFAGYSDNEFYLYGKKFFRKHTLSGDFNYLRNSNHFYGYDAANFTLEKNFTRQVFNIIDAKVNLTSHYADTTHVNHDLSLSFYNLTDKYGINESNIRANGLFKAYIKGERLNVTGTVDYYNHKMNTDTVNNTIVRLYPCFLAESDKFKADIGIMPVIDQFSDSNAKFYFYPKLNVSYNVYKNIIVPYAGITGDLKKNSFRSMIEQNPFMVSNPVYRNTNTKFELLGGLRGALSSNMNYDARVNFKRMADMAMFQINYDDALNNRFNVIYDDADQLTLSGQLQYSQKEKISIIASGNYYKYIMNTFKYAWHRPSFDIKVSALYNLKSKIIAKADLFFIGNQWAQQKQTDSQTGASVLMPVNLKGVADLNLGLEYRYSKFLSAFVNFNNIANFRYYRWDRYPTQRFNFMVGVTFIPF